MSPTAVSLLIPASVLLGALLAWGVNALVNPSDIAGYAVEHNTGFAVVQVIVKDGRATRITIIPKVDREIRVTLHAPRDEQPSVTLSASGGRVASREVDNFRWSTMTYQDVEIDEVKSWSYS